MNWLQLADEVIAGKVISDDEALAILNSDDDDILKLMDGAFAIRKHYYGKKVKLNMIMNAKSGYCCCFYYRQPIDDFWYFRRASTGWFHEFLYK